MLDIGSMQKLLECTEIESLYSKINAKYKSFSNWQNNTIVLCGLSPYAKNLADSLLAQGVDSERILIIDTEQNKYNFYKNIKICDSSILDNHGTLDGVCNEESTLLIICSNPYLSHYANLLVNSGKRNVMTYHLLCICDKRYDYELERYNSNVIVSYIKFLLQNKEFYLRFLDDLADNISKTIMYKWIMYHLTLDIEHCCVEFISPPYFGQTILNPEVYRVFADLGGYDGDTLRDFLSLDIEFDEYWFFEVDEDLYGRAMRLSNDPRIKYNNIAIGRSTGISFFKKASNLSTTGAVSEKGEIEVRIDAIDNISSLAAALTAIKMDIEGGEEDALIGARNTIRKNRPALIVSVEHKPDDIKTLSELILKFNDGYRFYLRCCTSSIYTDLTMYAVDARDICGL